MADTDTFIAALAVGLALVGCNEAATTDIQPTLRFADLTDTPVTYLASAAFGSEGLRALQQVQGYLTTPEHPTCPTVERDYPAFTIRGGCMTAAGRIEGIVTVLVDDKGGHDYRFFNYVVNDERYNGWIITTSTSGDSATSLDMDIVVERRGLQVRSDFRSDGCRNNKCTTVGGLELVGRGGARIDSTSSEASAKATLEGADTLEVTVSHGCMSWRVGERTANVECLQ